MGANTYGECLRQFARAVDHVTEITFRQVIGLMADYADKELGFGYFELMEPQEVNGKKGLATFGVYLNGRRLTKKYSTELFAPGRASKPKTQSAFAYTRRSRLWVVSKTKKPLGDCQPEDVEDQWSQKSLPTYKQIEEFAARTSVIVPVCRGAELLGVVDFEGKEYIPYAKTVDAELNAIVDSIAQLWFLYQALETQNRGTEEALDRLNDMLASGVYHGLGTSKLFLAYPGRARNEDVLKIIKDVLGKFRERIEIVDWGELETLGDIPKELLDRITECRFGICYFSEKIAGETDGFSFQDNPNVLFEAGMFHALANRPLGFSRAWIPIREEESSPAPFDFASLRMLVIRRDGQGRISDDEEKRIGDDLCSKLRDLLETC